MTTRIARHALPRAAGTALPRAARLALAAACLFPLTALAQSIERIEPPHWWTGMKSDRLQLMVHGERIGTTTPALRHPGVTIERVTRSDNPNYLFVDLRIARDAKPGRLELAFRHPGGEVKRAYELQAREPGSAQRRGFGPADVILNLMPDRFANGNPANDTVPGYPDKFDRADNDAGRHGGDIAGLAKSLDYIAGMGYTMVWPTPLLESNQKQYSYHGYAGTDAYKVDPRYGSNEEYRAFVRAAKAKGIGVIQDIVLNHIGSDHWWMRDMPMKDWLTHGGKFVPTGHARTTASDPYAAKSDAESMVQGWFEPNMPDMNQKNPHVATYQIQNSIWWIEYAGLAGIRADTYGYSDNAFLAEWSRRIMEEYPNFNIVGEEWSDTPAVVAHWLRGRKNANGYVSSLPSGMDFPLNTILKKSLVAEDGLHSGLATLYEALVNDTLYPQPEKMVLFEGNHDVPRLYSALDEDFDLWKMAVAYVLTMRRTPQFYYGTELLMTSPKVRADGEFRKEFPGGWPDHTVNAFTGEGLTPRQKEAQAFLRTLLNWRKQRPVIHGGRLMHFQPMDGTYVYFRYDGAKKVMVAINKNRKEAVLQTARFAEMLPRATSGVDAITGKRYTVGPELALPARSVLVLDLQ